MFDWIILNDKFYYFKKDTGKVIGFSSKHALSDVWYSVAYIGDNRFTPQDEIHLGQYINLDFARQAIVTYWEIESRTLIE